MYLFPHHLGKEDEGRAPQWHSKRTAITDFSTTTVKAYEKKKGVVGNGEGGNTIQSLIHVCILFYTSLSLFLVYSCTFLQ